MAGCVLILFQSNLVPIGGPRSANTISRLNDALVCVRCALCRLVSELSLNFSLFRFAVCTIAKAVLSVVDRTSLLFQTVFIHHCDNGVVIIANLLLSNVTLLTAEAVWYLLI